MAPIRSACALLVLGLLAGSAAGQERGNVLVVVLDDVGVDRIAAYGEHPDAGPTPVIDALAAQGVLFRNAYAHPVCSPSRMAMLTGRHGFRTGVGEGLPWTTLGGPVDPFVPATHETYLPEVLGPAGYWTAVIGKWHLVVTTWTPDPFMHPILAAGFALHVGCMAQLETFSKWTKNVATAAGAQASMSTQYATSDNVDDALHVIERLGDRPWLIWLAFNAAHKPWHVPPAELHTLPVTAASSDALLYRADLEALDTELGRLLAEMPRDVRARTTILVIGDNGTPQAAKTPPFVQGHAKGTVYEGGIHVPLIVSGHRVASPGREVTALVHAVDLFATVIELAGATDPGTGVDSVSLLPYLEDPAAPVQRRWVFSETFFPNGHGPYQSRARAVRDPRWKLIAKQTATGWAEQFFDLTADPSEQTNLLPDLTPEQQQAFDALSAVMDGMTPD